MDSYSSNTCRVCLKTTGDISLYDKYESSQIIDLLISLTKITMHMVEDGLSAMCNNCFGRLVGSIKLIDQVKKTEEIYRKLCYVEKSENVNCSVYYVDNTAAVDDDTQTDVDHGIEIEEHHIDHDIDYNIDHEESNEMIIEDIASGETISTEIEENTAMYEIALEDTAEKAEEPSEINEDSITIISVEKCDDTENRQLKSEKLERHEYLHEHVTGQADDKNIISYNCSLCSKTFTQHNNFLTHMKNVHNNDREFVCDICSKQFKTNAGLTQHSLTHQTERNFICENCPKIFRDKYALSRHSLIHSGLKTQSCDLCEKKFYRTNDLTRHVRTFHLKLKNFKCSVCDKAFSNTGNLQAHVRIHTGEKPYECKFCNAKFNQSTPLVRHMRQQHKDLYKRDVDEKSN